MGISPCTLSPWTSAPAGLSRANLRGLFWHAAARRRGNGRSLLAVLAEEGTELGVSGRLRVGVLEEGVHLPRDAVAVPDPELVGLGVAARRALLLEERDLALLHPDHLGGDVARGRVADAEVAQHPRLPSDVEGEDDRRVLELELGVVMPDLRGLDPEEPSILLDGFGDALNVDRDVKGVGHDVLLRSDIDTLRYDYAQHRLLSICRWPTCRVLSSRRRERSPALRVPVPRLSAGGGHTGAAGRAPGRRRASIPGTSSSPHPCSRRQSGP